MQLLRHGTPPPFLISLFYFKCADIRTREINVEEPFILFHVRCADGIRHLHRTTRVNCTTDQNTILTNKYKD